MVNSQLSANMLGLLLLSMPLDMDNPRDRSWEYDLSSDSYKPVNTYWLEIGTVRQSKYRNDGGRYREKMNWRVDGNLEMSSFRFILRILVKFRNSQNYFNPMVNDNITPNRRMMETNRHKRGRLILFVQLSANILASRKRTIDLKFGTSSQTIPTFQVPKQGKSRYFVTGRPPAHWTRPSQP